MLIKFITLFLFLSCIVSAIGIAILGSGGGVEGGSETIGILAMETADNLLLEDGTSNINLEAN